MPGLLTRGARSPKKTLSLNDLPQGHRNTLQTNFGYFFCVLCETFASFASGCFEFRPPHISLAFTRGSITAYSTSTTKLTMTTIAASSITQLRTTITSRLAMLWKIRRPRPGR